MIRIRISVFRALGRKAGSAEWISASSSLAWKSRFVP